MGFPKMNRILTSGELAWQHLLKFHRGSRCCAVTWRSYREEGFFDGLDMEFSSIDEADILFLHGSEVIAGQSNQADTDLNIVNDGRLDEPLATILEVAVARGIPVVCANIDYIAVGPSGTRSFMPGTILANYYAKGGLNAVPFGKPLLEFFSEAMGTSDAIPRTGQKAADRVLHIGDSLHHDIAGACAAEIDSLLITKFGVHRERLHPNNLDTADPLLIRVTDLCDELDTPRPTFFMEALTL